MMARERIYTACSENTGTYYVCTIETWVMVLDELFTAVDSTCGMVRHATNDTGYGIRRDTES